MDKVTIRIRSVLSGAAALIRSQFGLRVLNSPWAFNFGSEEGEREIKMLIWHKVAVIISQLSSGPPWAIPLDGGLFGYFFDFGALFTPVTFCPIPIFELQWKWFTRGHQSAIPGGVFRDCEKSGPSQWPNSLGALRSAEKSEAAWRDAVGSSPWRKLRQPGGMLLGALRGPESNILLSGNLRRNCPQTALIMIAPWEGWDETRVASSWGLAERISTLKTNYYFHLSLILWCQLTVFRMLHLFSFFPSGGEKRSRCLY